MTWLRLDAQLFSNPDFQDLLDIGIEVGMLWIFLLCRAKEKDDGGFLASNNVTARNVMRVMQLRETFDVESALSEMVQLNLIDRVDDGYQICNWNKYQQDRSNAERQRKHREKKKGSNGVTGVTLRNGCNGIPYGTGQYGTGEQQTNIVESSNDKTKSNRQDNEVQDDTLRTDTGPGEFEHMKGKSRELADCIRKYFPDYDAVSLIKTVQALRPVVDRIDGNWSVLVERCARRWTSEYYKGDRDQLRMSLCTWFENKADGKFEEREKGQQNQPKQTPIDEINKRIIEDQTIDPSEFVDILNAALEDGPEWPSRTAQFVSDLERIGRIERTRTGKLDCPDWITPTTPSELIKKRAARIEPDEIKALKERMGVTHL
ncbi:MAG: hypothetical protein GY854_19705 [Deltaproteobacteria bacterium]|nr:hypothetical protein [Deltaproteobacteria bacterium]